MPKWLENKITLGNIINLATLAFAVAGFYFTTTITLDRHAQDLKTIFDRAERFEKTETAAREKLREAFMQRLERVVEQQNIVIQRTTVVETELKGIRTDLQRLFEKIDRKP